MTSEIRANTLKNRVGLGTVSFTNTGPVVSGIVTANGIRLADNNKIQLGDGQDIEVYHDGSYSYLQAQGTLFIDANGDINLRNPNNGEYKAAFNNNGAVSLHHNGQVKFATTSTGINVTGSITGTGDFTLTDTATDSSAGPEFKLFRNSASPADADYLGQIKFAGESDTGVERNYAKITGKILDASNGTEDGIIEFAHIKAGSQTITGRWRSDSLQLLNGTALTVAGSTTVTGNIIPSSDSATDIGTNSVRFANIYADTLYGDGSNLTGITQTTINNNTDNYVVTATGTANTLQGESSFTYNAGSLIVSNANGNVTQQLNATSGDAKIVLDNSGNNNYSAIDFERERSSGAGVNGGSIFMKSDTSSNNAYLYIQAQSASAQAPTTSALSAGNGVRLILKGGQGIFSVEAGASEKFLINSEGRLFVNSTAVVNTDDFLTIKRPAGNYSVNSMTLDATTATGSHANALVFTKAKDYYYNGIVFTSSNGHQGGLCGKMTTSGGTAPQIDLRIGGSGFNSSDTLAMTVHANGPICLGNSTTVTHHNHTKLEVKSGSQVSSSYGVAYFQIESPSNNPCVVIDNSTGGNSNETHGLLIRNTAAGYGLRIDADGSGGNPFIVDSAGDVRIGRETDLGGGLDVFDKKLILSKTGSGTRNWAFVNNNIQAGNLGIQVSASTDGTDWANRIEIDANGQVCIGNPAIDPTHRLVLLDNQSGDIDTLFLKNSNQGTRNSTNIVFAPSNGVATVRIGGWASSDASTTANRDGDFYVETRKDGTYREHLRVSNTGKIIMATNTTQGTSYEDDWDGSHPQNVFNSFINYKHFVGYNQYTWYKYTAGAGSSSRPQWVHFKVMWSTGHASGVACWDFHVLTRNPHNSTTAYVERCILKHQYYHNGSYYGWTSTPNVHIYSATDTGSSAGFYLRVQGHGDHNSSTFNMQTMHSWHILAFDNQYEGINNSKFEFVTNNSGGPSGASQQQSWHSPDTGPP